MSNYEIQDTLQFAFNAHKNQFRNDGVTPYIVHPIDVMNRLKGWGIKDLTLWKAALCHDILEDTGITEFRLGLVVGEQVARICAELTLPKAADKVAYMNSFDTKNVEALVVKCADRICNIFDFQKDEPKYAPKYFKKANGLWKAFSQRRFEVEANFGGGVATAIEFSIIRFEMLFNE